MKLIKGEFKEKLDLLFAPAVRAGFPSPADDYMAESLDFNRDLIKHPEATFYGQVDGDSMIDLAIDVSLGPGPRDRYPFIFLLHL